MDPDKSGLGLTLDAFGHCMVVSCTQHRRLGLQNDNEHKLQPEHNPDLDYLGRRISVDDLGLQTNLDYSGFRLVLNDLKFRLGDSTETKVVLVPNTSTQTRPGCLSTPTRPAWLRTHT